MKTVTKTNSTFKTFRVLGIIIGFFGESLAFEFFFWLLGEKIKTRNQMRANKVSRYSRAILAALNVKIAQPQPILPLKPGLIVCNHLSYIDAFVIAAVAPSLFVTSVEIRDQSWIGSLAKLAGCLFVERRSRTGTGQEVRAIDLVLTLGTSVVVFPEATSTAGQNVLPFKAALYQAAIDAQVAIHHFCIRYEQAEIPYIGTMTIGPHLSRLIGLPEIPVQLRYLGSFNEPHSPHRHEIAQRSHQLVQHAYLSF